MIYELRLLPNRSGRGHEASIPQHMLMFNDQSPNPCEKYMNIPWKMGSAPAANSKIQAWARARNKSPVAHNKYIERLDEKYMFGHARACRRSCPVQLEKTQDRSSQNLYFSCKNTIFVMNNAVFVHE